MINAKSLEQNISNGRKIFRLFLWLNEIDGFHQIINNDKLKPEIKALKGVSSVCSFIYFFSDNFKWLSKIGIVSPYVPFSKYFSDKEILWRRIKDKFSLYKTVMELIIYSYTYIIKKAEDRELFAKLDAFDE